VSGFSAAYRSSRRLCRFMGDTLPYSAALSRRAA